MYKRMGNKFALVTAAALLLAACSGKEEEPASTAPTVDEGPIDTTPVEQPKTAEQIKIETYGLEDQTGLDGYSGGRVFFAYDSSELTDDGRATLQKAAEWLGAYPRVNFTVEGHCDERGTREYNLALGERRASAVKNYLVALGVPASRVSTISYGKERPQSPGAHDQNRRGVLVVK